MTQEEINEKINKYFPYPYPGQRSTRLLIVDVTRCGEIYLDYE